MDYSLAFFTLKKKGVEKMSPMTVTLLILLAIIIAFVSGKVPISIIGIGVMFALALFQVLPPERAFGGLVNTSVILFAAMFVISKAIQKSSIVTTIANLVRRFKEKPRLLIFLTCLIAAIMAMISSATITIVILIPILSGICDEIGLSRSKILYPALCSALSGTASWFLGMGALNMSWSSVMMKLGAKAPININDFLVARLPFALATILFMTFIGPKLLPNHSNKELRKDLGSGSRKKNGESLSRSKNKIAITIITVTIIAMFLSTYLKIQTYIIAIAGALLLVCFGILSNKEALRAINLNVIFLVAGMLGLADALQQTGAGKLVGNSMARVATNIDNPFLMMGLFYAVSLIIANLIGGIGTISILVPLWTLTCLKLGLDPRGAVLAASTASAFAMLTPVGGHQLPLIMGPGGYTLNDFLKCGLPLALILCILGCFVTELMYPL